jgi:hypothetical protein
MAEHHKGEVAQTSRRWLEISHALSLPAKYGQGFIWGERLLSKRNIAPQRKSFSGVLGLFAKGENMLHKLHNPEEAAHAQCLALLVEFVTAVRAEKTCLMCGAKLGTDGLKAHRPGCATRRADAFITKHAPPTHAERR